MLKMDTPHCVRTYSEASLAHVQSYWMVEHITLYTAFMQAMFVLKEMYYRPDCLFLQAN